MTEKEKMLKGLIYDSSNKELVDIRRKAHKLCFLYNQTSEEDFSRRKEILNELGIRLGKHAYLQGPIYFDYGCFISIGENTYANFNLTILDTCPVNIGSNVFIGSGVSIVTPLHPLRYQERNAYYNEQGKLVDKEYGKSITIEDDCWIASNVTICPGVTIGRGTVIGAGSVVTHNIPPHVLAAGNPCHVIREITEEDTIEKGEYYECKD